MKLLFKIALAFLGYKALGQELNNVEIQKQFEKSIANYLKQEFLHGDSNLFILYKNDYNFYLEEDNLNDGKFLSLRDSKARDPEFSNDIDSSNQQPGLYKKMDFITFINYILSHKQGKNWTFSRLSGTWIYINCPLEMWEQFYFDIITFKLPAVLTPFVDILIFRENKVKYIRELLVCEYTQATKFIVKKSIKMKEYDALTADD